MLEGVKMQKEKNTKYVIINSNLEYIRLVEVDLVPDDVYQMNFNEKQEFFDIEPEQDVFTLNEAIEKTNNLLIALVKKLK